MLNCLTYIAFVYWAVTTVHTILPLDVAVCGANASRGGLGALFSHAFGGDLDVDVDSWHGFPCSSGLLRKMAFILCRPAATVRHIMCGGGQHEPFVPILFIVPLVFITIVLLRRLGLPVLSMTAARTLLKFGVAVGCRSMIILNSLLQPTKESVYFKRYSKMEFCIIAWTAYIIELPVWAETLVSGGTALSVLLLCGIFPHHMLPEVNPANVATQAVAAAAFGIWHAWHQQRRRAARVRAAGAGRSAAKAADADAAATAVAELEHLLEDERKLQQQRPQRAAATSGSPDSGGASTSMAAGSGGKPPVGPACSGGTAAATAAAPTASLAALRRIQAMPGRSYTSPARPCRFAIKIRHAHLNDLPENLLGVINTAVLAGSGWKAINAHAREGCVELVLDLRPLTAVRTWSDDGSSGGGGGGTSDDLVTQHDQGWPEGIGGGGDGNGNGAAAATAAPPAAASLGELGRAIVSYLHSTNVIRPEREQSIVLQMGTETVLLTWQGQTETWVLTEAATEESTAGPAPPPPLPPPLLLQVSPRVALWPGADTRLRLTAVLAGPSAEEILAGSGLVVRNASGTLSYSVLHVQSQSPQAAVAVAAVPSLSVELAVSGIAASGLLTVEARSSAGLLSAPAVIVVDHDAAVVSGLLALAAGMDEPSADSLLHDYGTWLDLATRCATAAVAQDVYDKGSSDDDAASLGAGGGDCGNPADAASAAAAAAVGSATPRARKLGPAAAPVPHAAMPHHSLRRARWDQGTGNTGACYSGVGTPSVAMLAIAADLLGACCRCGGDGGGNNDAAIAAVTDRLITCVLTCDNLRSPAAAFASLLDAVPTPPINAGVLHMAIAAGSRAIVEVVVRWYETLYGGNGGNAVVRNLWLSRAACGVTPLHVAAAMPDGGAMAAWLLHKYDTAAAAWDDADFVSDDGLTPRVLAEKQGHRWRLLCAMRAIRVVQVVRRKLTASLARAVELLWGFREPPLERRFMEAVSGQTVASLALYTTANALLPVLFALAKATMYGSSETTTVLAALAFHVPHAALLLSWICQVGGAAAGAGADTAASKVAHLSPPFQPPPPSWPRPYLSLHLHRRHCSNATTSTADSQSAPLAAAAAATAKIQPGRFRRHFGGGGSSPSLPEPSGLLLPRLRVAMLVVHVCRAAAKAAMGLSVWPFALPRGVEVFLARGGDIALEAVVRPLLDQLDLPSRLLISLVDAPAMWVLYRGMERKYPGGRLTHGALERVLLYQAILLATTAAVSISNRIRFLHSQKVWENWVRDGVTTWEATAAAPAAAAALPSLSSSALLSPWGGDADAGGGGGGGSFTGKGGRPRPLNIASSGGAATGGKGHEAGAAATAASAASAKMLWGDDQTAARAAAAATAIAAAPCHSKQMVVS